MPGPMPTRMPTPAPEWASLQAGPRLLNQLALLLLAAALPTLALGWLDPRTVEGLPWAAHVRAKPLKFQLSMALHLSPCPGPWAGCSASAWPCQGDRCWWRRWR